MYFQHMAEPLNPSIHHIAAAQVCKFGPMQRHEANGLPFAVKVYKLNLFIHKCHDGRDAPVLSDLNFHYPKLLWGNEILPPIVRYLIHRI